MSRPAARENDPVKGVDSHIVMVPTPGGATPTPMQLPFDGTLKKELSKDVFINGRAAATQDSLATQAPHKIPPSCWFQVTPKDEGKVIAKSKDVLVNDRKLAGVGDQVTTCNDPSPLPTSSITSGSSDVFVS